LKERKKERNIIWIFTKFPFLLQHRRSRRNDSDDVIRQRRNEINDVYQQRHNEENEDFKQRRNEINDNSRHRRYEKDDDVLQRVRRYIEVRHVNAAPIDRVPVNFTSRGDPYARPRYSNWKIIN